MKNLLIVVVVILAGLFSGCGGEDECWNDAWLWGREKKRSAIDVIDWTHSVIKTQRVLAGIMSGGYSEEYLFVSEKIRNSIHDDTMCMRKEMEKRRNSFL